MASPAPARLQTETRFRLPHLPDGQGSHGVCCQQRLVCVPGRLPRTPGPRHARGPSWVGSRSLLGDARLMGAPSGVESVPLGGQGGVGGRDRNWRPRFRGFRVRAKRSAGRSMFHWGARERPGSSSRAATGQRLRGRWLRPEWPEWQQEVGLVRGAAESAPMRPLCPVAHEGQHGGIVTTVVCKSGTSETGRSPRGEGPQAPGPAASSGASSPYPDRRPRPGRVRAARAEPRAWRAALSREPAGRAARRRPGWRLALNLRETLSSPFRGSDGNGPRPASGCFESEFPGCHLNKNVRCRPVGEGLSLREPRALSGGRRPAGPGVLLWGHSGQRSCD